jgi:hypothetical protein
VVLQAVAVLLRTGEYAAGAHPCWCVTCGA